MQYHPLPVIVISSLGQASCQATLDALRFGAVEVLAKPGGPYSVGELPIALAGKVRAAATARIRRSTPTESQARVETIQNASTKPFRSDVVIAIGASTGGTEAIQEVLPFSTKPSAVWVSGSASLVPTFPKCKTVAGVVNKSTCPVLFAD